MSAAPRPPSQLRVTGSASRRRSVRLAIVVVAAMLLLPALALLLVQALLPDRVARAITSSEPSVARPVIAVADRTPEVRGKVLDAEGQPVMDARVLLLTQTAPSIFESEAKTDGLGGFSFVHLKPGSFRVVAEHGPQGSASSADVRVAKGETTELTLVLAPAGAVRGTVIDSDGKAVVGATLSLEGVPWETPNVTSDSQGAFRFEAVPDDATSLVAFARGYRTARMGLGHRTEHVDVVLRVALTTAPPVAGEVRDVDGNPAPKVRVVACAKQPYETSASSGEDGTFQLPPQAIGCEAIAYHDEVGASDPVVVTDGHKLILQLKAPGAIEGTVVDERGAPIAAFKVGVESHVTPQGRSRGSGSPRAFEDPGGAFRLDKLAPGTYVLTASVPGKPPARSNPVNVTAGATTSGVRITILAGGAVSGRVYDQQHVPIAGAKLRFDAVSSVIESNAETRSDEQGQYRLEGAPAGPFTVQVEKEGFRPRMLSGLRVDSAGTLTRDVTLTALDGGNGGLELGGIGAMLRGSREGVAVASVIPGEPAEKSGLKAGDRFIRIDGDDAEGMSVADILQRLRGEPETSVGVSVRRPETDEILEFMIVRAAIVRR